MFATNDFVCDDAVEEICRHGQDLGEVAPRRLEVEARELKPLVDVDVGEELDLGVL